MTRTKGITNKKSTEERFFDKILVDELTQCWNVQTSTPNPAFHVGDGVKRNFRTYSWFLYSGNYPDGTMEMRCKNYFCVNPEHIIIMRGWQDRFWYYVDKKGTDECWEWTAHKDDRGYGIFNHPYSTKAHRLSWLCTKGEIPNGLVVCHKCDNPSCVNPDHLWLGTVADNNRDKVAKGRQKGAQGERNFGAILTEKQVDVVRFLYKSKEYSTYDLADIFQVSRNCISRIVNNITWSNK